jgi:hypothetical protein
MEEEGISDITASGMAFHQQKRVFEMMQNELEEITERLSEMIARPYLRTSRFTVISNE